MKTKKISPKKKIINAAIKCFGKRGIEHTKLTEISQIMGIRHSAILYHFKTFEQLCDAVIDDLIEEFHSAGEKFLPSQSHDPIDYIMTFIRVHFLMAKKNKIRFSLWLHFYYKASVSENYSKKLRMIRLNSSEKLKTLLSQLYMQQNRQFPSDQARSQQLEDDTITILGILSGNVILSMTDDENEFDHYLEITQNFITRYLSPSKSIT